MANELRLRVNEMTRTVAAAPDTPLLYVLKDDPALQGTDGRSRNSIVPCQRVLMRPALDRCCPTRDSDLRRRIGFSR